MIFKKKLHPVAALIQTFFDNKQKYSVSYCITDAWLNDLISQRDYELLERIYKTRFGNISDMHHPAIQKLLKDHNSSPLKYISNHYQPPSLVEYVERQLINIRLDKLQIINRIWEGDI